MYFLNFYTAPIFVSEFGPRHGYGSGSRIRIHWPDWIRIRIRNSKQCSKLAILHFTAKNKRKSSPHPRHPHSPDSRDRRETSRPPPSAGCSARTWQAICNTAQQQLASYLQYRPATIGELSAIPPSNNWQPSRNPGNTTGQCSGSIPFFLVRILGSKPRNNGSGCGSAPKIFRFRINEI